MYAQDIIFVDYELGYKSTISIHRNIYSDWAANLAYHVFFRGL